jgi:pimeloyl-ACP methyl ester carboxylesterase
MATVEAGGTTLAYDDEGGGPAVLLLHAGFVDRRMWDAQAPALAERLRVVRYDQRGYGESARLDGTPYVPHEDALAMLDSLGIDRAALVGVSRGGRVALDLALAAPERVSALVLVCAAVGGAPLELDVPPELEARWDAAEAAGDLATLAEIDLEIWAPLGDEGGLRQMALDNAHANLVPDPAAWPESPPAAARLAEVRAPTLVVDGDRDVPAVASLAARLAAGIPDARRVTVRGADHFPNVRRPEEFNRLVLEFLAPPTL